jgi:hypothetical protein
MELLTVGRAAALTGWSPRMLRYLEQCDLVVPERTPKGYRLYGLRELMVLRDIGRIERYEKEWTRLHAADPPPKPAPRLVLETTK